MSHRELRLISEIIRKKELRKVTRANIDHKMLMLPETKEMFKYIRDYYHNKNHYGMIPSRRIMSEHFPSFQYVEGGETLEELCEEVRNHAMTSKILNLCNDVLEKIDVTSNPFDALSVLRSGLSQIHTMIPSSHDLILADSAEDLIEEYDSFGSMTGFPWPWEPLNIETQGMQQQDLIILFSRPKNMKSWLVTKIVTHLYLEANARVMIYSCEMPPWQYRRRMACCICELDYDRLKKKLLSPQEESFFKRVMRSIKRDEQIDSVNGHHRSVLFTSFSDDPTGGGVAHLIAKAEAFEPDIIWVDAFYRMKDDRSGVRSPRWQQQAAITQDLKNATQILNVPIIGVTQRTRNGKNDNKENREDEESEQMEDIAYSDSVGQEADFVLRVKKGTRYNPDGTIPIDVEIAGAREIRASGFTLSVLPCTHWQWNRWKGNMFQSESDKVRAIKCSAPSNTVEEDILKMTRE
jgi:replicative DNA helicase